MLAVELDLQDADGIGRHGAFRSLTRLDRGPLRSHGVFLLVRLLPRRHGGKGLACWAQLASSLDWHVGVSPGRLLAAGIDILVDFWDVVQVLRLEVAHLLHRVLVERAAEWPRAGPRPLGHLALRCWLVLGLLS